MPPGRTSLPVTLDNHSVAHVSVNTMAPRLAFGKSYECFSILKRILRGWGVLQHFRYGYETMLFFARAVVAGRNDTSAAAKETIVISAAVKKTVVICAINFVESRAGVAECVCKVCKVATLRVDLEIVPWYRERGCSRISSGNQAHTTKVSEPNKHSEKDCSMTWHVRGVHDSDLTTFP
ncbi:uncharacterized protein BDZ99DRAFT_483672 [Mytilinidion resinicola]|uniref:Uncharacterized protein n=1 Tax=Mytilinidion resinicola TaxID=574789 RepID=A0A6A6XYS3_9PEZI|nr:uncharacterized protein BDZ99DRAFT_483672 [Mytilinidion resinicola]KAF2801428.1 hypothetical protein BDZ99DRAFT_483672 [Mytilinidion resinicola]